MGEVCSRHGMEEKYLEGLIGKAEVRILLG
jgi:hypothetical protein